MERLSGFLSDTPPVLLPLLLGNGLRRGDLRAPVPTVSSPSPGAVGGGTRWGL